MPKNTRNRYYTEVSPLLPSIITPSRIVIATSRSFRIIPLTPLLLPIQTTSNFIDRLDHFQIG